MDASRIVNSFDLNSCVSCRACSESCPSYRNGGVDPEQIISQLLSNEDVTEIWNCLQCERCTMICPQSIDVAGVMLTLRQIDSEKGNAPDRFKKTELLVMKDGFIAMPKGRMGALRKDLELDDIIVDEKTMEELNIIFKEVRSS